MPARATSAGSSLPIDGAGGGWPSGVLDIGAMLAALALLLVLGRLLARRRGARSRVGDDGLRAWVWRESPRVGGAVGILAIILALPGVVRPIMPSAAAALDGAVTVLLAGLALVAALFLIRQMLAPPWWRYSAWGAATFDHGYTGSLRDIAAWIATDARQTLLTLRLLDRIVLVAGLVGAGWTSAQLIGGRATLTIAFAALGILYLALGVSLVTANRVPNVLLSRLVELRGVARRIAGGDYTARAAPGGLDQYAELGELVRDVNGMARVLETRQAENRALQVQLQAGLQAEQDRATRDGLTGMRNHRYFQESLAAELARSGQTGAPTSIAILDLDNFKAVNDTHGHHEGDAVLRRVATALDEGLRSWDLAARLGGEEFGIIFPATLPEHAKTLLDELHQLLASAGPDGGPQTFSAGVAAFPGHAREPEVLMQLADAASYSAKLAGKRRVVVHDPAAAAEVDPQRRVDIRARDAQLQAARTLVRIADGLDGLGVRHSESVARLAVQLATTLACDEEQAQQVYLCGLLHDVGKLGLDQHVVRKATPLSEAEFAELQRHPDLSAQIATNVGLGAVATFIRHHHEHWDGTGYPQGLAGRQIPLPSRIVLVADAFAAMTSHRSWTGALTPVAALEELVRDAGTRFDPDVVGALMRLTRLREDAAA